MCEAREFKVGDVVRLKSGSPRMIINLILNLRAELVWTSYNTHEPQQMFVTLEGIRHD